MGVPILHAVGGHMLFVCINYYLCSAAFQQASESHTRMPVCVHMYRSCSNNNIDVIWSVHLLWCLKNYTADNYTIAGKNSLLMYPLFPDHFCLVDSGLHVDDVFYINKDIRLVSVHECYR